MIQPPTLMLLTSSDGPSVLHIFSDGRCVKTVTGRAETLRALYGESVPSFDASAPASAPATHRGLDRPPGSSPDDCVGVCRQCGCTDADCAHCVKKTGQPCSWANSERTLCTVCAGAPFSAKATV